MLKQFTKDFGEFVNESAESDVAALSLSEFMPLFSKLVTMCPNLEEFMYPSDAHGQASRTVTLSRNGKYDENWMFTKEAGLSKMEKDLTEIEDFYKSRGEKDIPVFYVWEVYTKGLPYNELKKRLAAVGGMPSYQDIRLPELINLLKSDKVLCDSVIRIRTALRSIASTEFGKALSRGEFNRLD